MCHKLYLPPVQGGLGLIKIANYITALQCAWIKRTGEHWCDNWRYDIKKACYGNPLIANESTFSQLQNPILYNICSSFGKFSAEFCKKDQNYKKALVFNNKMFKRGRNDNGILDKNFFGNRRSFEDLLKIARLTFGDFFVRGRPKTLHQLNYDTGIEFDLNCYMRLHAAFQFYLDSRRNDEPTPEQSISFFMKTFTKGSRPYRRILENFINGKETLAQNISVATFFGLLDTGILNETLLKHCWGMWNNTYFINTQREFLYKYFNNILGLNARVSKFIVGYSAECTFCVASKEPLPINSEGFIHLFFECPHGSKYRNMAERDFFPEILAQSEENKKFFGCWAWYRMVWNSNAIVLFKALFFHLTTLYGK